MGYDLTLHKKNIKNHAIRKLDFSTNPNLSDSKKMEALLAKCEKITEEGFVNLKLSKSTLRGKSVYKVKSLEHELVLRLISKNLKRLTGIRQNNRNSIIKALKTLFEEGIDFNVYKLDIKSFYENVNPSKMLSKLASDPGFSRSHLKLLESFFDSLQQNNVQGLARGLAVSAVISEYVLRSFDRHVEQQPTVFFYQRFVDDIIIITHPEETQKRFSKVLKKYLPEGLEFNHKKNKFFTFLEPPLATGDPESIKDEVNFLGYNFKIYKRKRNGHNPIERKVTVDISKSKTNKIKTKIVKSIIEYCKNGSFHDLENRIRLLSGNYSIFDHGRGIRRKAGIYYNYRMVDAASSNSLIELDNFLRKILLSKSGNVCAELSKKLNNKQRRNLLKYSFVKGFERRLFYNFSGDELAKLMKCWAYV